MTAKELEKKKKQAGYTAKYDATHCKVVAVKLNIKTDEDIIRALLASNLPSAAFLKMCVREHIANHGTDDYDKVVVEKFLIRTRPDVASKQMPDFDSPIWDE